LDACTKGAGYKYSQEWAYADWHCDFPHLSKVHINLKETITIVLAARRLGPLVEGLKGVIL